jgi:hypothetical protein
MLRIKQCLHNAIVAHKRNNDKKHSCYLASLRMLLSLLTASVASGASAAASEVPGPASASRGDSSGLRDDECWGLLGCRFEPFGGRC